MKTEGAGPVRAELGDSIDFYASVEFSTADAGNELLLLGASGAMPVRRFAALFWTRESALFLFLAGSRLYFRFWWRLTGASRISAITFFQNMSAGLSRPG